MKFWLILILISLLLVPNAFAQDTHRHDDRDVPVRSAGEQGEPDEREIITVLLSHHHEVPDRAQLERVTTEARDIIFEIAADEDAFLFHRHRALRALTHWPDDEVYRFLHGLLVDNATEDGLRHHLIPILAAGFGERALADLEPFLRHSEDPQIRISAAGAIAQIPGEEAHNLLISALHEEENAIVRTRLESFITRLR